MILLLKRQYEIPYYSPTITTKYLLHVLISCCVLQKTTHDILLIKLQLLLNMIFNIYCNDMRPWTMRPTRYLETSGADQPMTKCNALEA